MILLDSLYINNGGGKVLLDYLVRFLEEKKIDVYYLFDSRCADDFNFIPNNRKTFLNPSLLLRHKYYKQNKDKFTKIFCMGNLGPTIKLSVPVFVYFHQRLFLDQPKSISIINQFIFRFKSFIFKQLLSNVDLVFLQTESIKEELLNKCKVISKENVLVLPFYENMIYPDVVREKDSFLYVSSGTMHKNHLNLLHAFANVYKKNNRGTLTLTISEEFPSVIEVIEKYKNEGVPIFNLGFVKKESLASIYASSQYCIFPSFSESFGLGIIEAIEGGCKIIGSDLPYLYTICVPSLTFDPNDINSIASKIEEAIICDIKETKLITANKINEIIQLLKK